MAGLEAACPCKRSIEGNVPSTDEEDESWGDKKAKWDGGTIVNELVADNGIEKEQPGSGTNGSNMSRGKALYRFQ